MTVFCRKPYKYWCFCTLFAAKLVNTAETCVFVMFLSDFCRKPCKYCCFCNFFEGFGHFAENLVKIGVFDREHGPGQKPSMEPAGIRVSTLRFPFPRSHSLENPSTKGCGKNNQICFQLLNELLRNAIELATYL